MAAQPSLDAALRRLSLPADSTAVDLLVECIDPYGDALALVPNSLDAAINDLMVLWEALANDIDADVARLSVLGIERRLRALRTIIKHNLEVAPAADADDGDESVEASLVHAAEE